MPSSELMIQDLCWRPPADTNDIYRVPSSCRKEANEAVPLSQAGKRIKYIVDEQKFQLNLRNALHDVMPPVEVVCEIEITPSSTVTSSRVLNYLVNSNKASGYLKLDISMFFGVTFNNDQVELMQQLLSKGRRVDIKSSLGFDLGRLEYLIGKYLENKVLSTNYAANVIITSSICPVSLSTETKSSRLFSRSATVFGKCVSLQDTDELTILYALVPQLNQLSK